MVSFAYPNQVLLVSVVCQSFVVDNGAFTAWKRGRTVNWTDFYAFVAEWQHHPSFDWAVIPDVIDGTEADNDTLVQAWPFRLGTGVPVWHLHESLTRLQRLAAAFPRIALGSSGQWARPGAKDWWERIRAALACISAQGQPITKLHGMRMLSPRVFPKLPLSSADSTNIAQNIGIDKAWRTGPYSPPTKAARGVILAERIESQQSAPRLTIPPLQRRRPNY